jgi:ABC-type enterochelin transport system substrate-binding protein
MALALLLTGGMRRLAIVLVVVTAVSGCAGYRQDATHRSAPSAGAASSATGPTADPDAHLSALPRAVVAMGRNARGDLPALGVLTGVVLLTALGLGVYTIRLVYRRPPPAR